MSKLYNWQELTGKSEQQAENYMLEHWGEIPPQWNDPLFRDQILGVSGQAELGAHMSDGHLKYANSLGSRTDAVWFERNIRGQGHPAEQAYLQNRRKEK